jgi:hypothetical protein
MSQLRLKKERLAELTSDELHSVAGAYRDITICDQCYSLNATCPSWQACTTAMSCGCQPTWNCA